MSRIAIRGCGKLGSMLRRLKQTALAVGKHGGIFGVCANSRWRQQRLLILCYHGLSIQDEHKWRPMYVSPEFFRHRMATLAKGGYNVLPLGQAVKMLQSESLPPKSVAITFDDGFYDFYSNAYPILRDFGFPATVYQTTYYCDYPFAVYHLALSFIFWRGRNQTLDASSLGIPGTFDLSKDHDRALSAFVEFARQQDYSPAEKDALVERVAKQLGIDYSEMRARRMLHLMKPEELAKLPEGGIDVELHTHRHRTPLDESLFVREIRENREWLTSKINVRPVHFCYPSGVHRNEFLPWLRAEKVVSATTCETGIAARDNDPLLLPRLLDSMNIGDVDFEGWLTGFSSFVPQRRA